MTEHAETPIDREAILALAGYALSEALAERGMEWTKTHISDPISRLGSAYPGFPPHNTQG